MIQLTLCQVSAACCLKDILKFRVIKNHSKISILVPDSESVQFTRAAITLTNMRARLVFNRN